MPPLVHDTAHDPQSAPRELTYEQFVAQMPGMAKLALDDLRRYSEEIEILQVEADIKCGDVDFVISTIRGALGAAPSAVRQRFESDFQRLEKYKAHWMGQFPTLLSESEALIAEYKAGKYDRGTLARVKKGLAKTQLIAPRAISEKAEWQLLLVEEQEQVTAFKDPKMQPTPVGTSLYDTPGSDRKMFVGASGALAPKTETKEGEPPREGEGEQSIEQLREFISHIDPVQGSLGDCFLVAALSALANARPDAVYDAIRETSPGNFSVRFFKKSKDSAYVPVYVAVDMALPQSEAHAKLITTQIQEKGFLGFFRNMISQQRMKEMWAAIIEKAYAKFQQVEKGEGSEGYKLLGAGGNANQLFEAVLGQAPKTETVREGKYALDGLWQKVKGNIQAGKPMASSTSVVGLLKQLDDGQVKGLYQSLAAGHADELREADGDFEQTLEKGEIAKMRGVVQSIAAKSAYGKKIVSTLNSAIRGATNTFGWHMYTIVDAREEGERRRVKLRNPHGAGGRVPNVAQRSSDDGDDDVTFWMDLEDYAKQFAAIETVT